MRRLILSSALASALALAAPPLLAQVYKWVDEKGVVNYSNEPPANAKATQLDPKASRLSIIGADDALKKRAPVPIASESALAEKIDRLERKLDAERYARNAADAQVQAAADSWYQQCLRDRRIDCDYAGMDPYYSGYGPYDYWPVVVTKTHSFRNKGMHHRPIAAPRQPGRAAFPPVRSGAAARQM